MKLYRWILDIAIAGNILYILWILYNGIDEGFKSISTIQGLAIIGILILLALNAFLLYNLRNLRR